MAQESRGIVAWPEGDRPRERLLRMGPEALTEPELVAILLRVGYQGTNAVELGRQVRKSREMKLLAHLWGRGNKIRFV